MLKVGQVLYKRYVGHVRRDGHFPWPFSYDDRVQVEWVDEQYVIIHGATFRLEPDKGGFSWKTFFSEV